MCTRLTKQSNLQSKIGRIARKHWETGRNHNPCVGCSSPSSGIRSSAGNPVITRDSADLVLGLSTATNRQKGSRRGVDVLYVLDDNHGMSFKTLEHEVARLPESDREEAEDAVIAVGTVLIHDTDALMHVARLVRPDMA